jgi:hypothetical protein
MSVVVPPILNWTKVKKNELIRRLNNDMSGTRYASFSYWRTKNKLKKAPFIPQ